MKNCAIVCEYNPFHTGHKYQLDRVRELGMDNIVCIMSGSFVQSAMPAFCDKALRAKCAILGGANAVIELPTVYATASAQIFAEGAVKIMCGIKGLTHIAMGARGNRDVILRIADLKTAKKQKFQQLLKNHLNEGKSYNVASVLSLAALYDKFYSDTNTDVGLILSDPNNILCIEYLSALERFGADIEPIIIERQGAAHNDTGAVGEYVSATAIRNAFDSNSEHNILRYIPFCIDEIKDWRNSHTPDLNLYKNIAMFQLKCANEIYISEMRNCSEGLEYSLKNIANSCDFDGCVDRIVSRRYSKKRIYRLFLDIVLGIDKTLADKKFVTRLLACNKDFDFSILPQFVKTDNAGIKNAVKLDNDVASVMNIDLKAALLYNTVCTLNGDYFNYSLVKV